MQNLAHAVYPYMAMDFWMPFKLPQIRMSAMKILEFVCPEDARIRQAHTNALASMVSLLPWIKPSALMYVTCVAYLELKNAMNFKSICHLRAPTFRFFVTERWVFGHGNVRKWKMSEYGWQL
jgi:hypothetical protein